MEVQASEIIEAMESMHNEEQRQILMRFFKCGKGQYGEGDQFLGLKVPQTRGVVKAAKGTVGFPEIERLIYCKWHEVRLCGFLLLVEEMQKAVPHGRNEGNAARRKELAELYLSHARQANNWDLVDLSAPYILGEFLLHPLPDGTMPSRSLLDRLAKSNNLWEQRIAIVSTLQLIRNHQYTDTLRIAEKLLCHPHDLIHKATGWMLREVGKRDMDTLEDFLEAHWTDMPRTTLRYAIERMPEDQRLYWLKRTK